MSTASRDAMEARRPGLRPLIITRSTFAGAGSKVGHWLGDNVSSWDKYRASIRTMLAFTSLYNFNMVGSDVCGFSGNTTEELCARWASLGAFSTFFRNHNEIGNIGQEFYRWASVAESARKAIDIRYRLLDYIYTAMWRANTDGTPAVHPIFYQYPEDKKAWALEDQYFFGPGLIVAPVLEEGADSVDIYLPKDLFYDWYSHEPVQGKAGTHTISNQDTTSIPLLIRSGIVMPLRASSANTTTDLRTKGFEILIATGKDGKAEGELYIDDGVSIEQKTTTHVKFSYDADGLSITGNISDDYPVKISKITVLSPKCKSKDKATGRFSRTKKVDRVVKSPQTIKVGS